MDFFEKDGTWWLPNAPSEVVKGTLRHTPEEGLYLELQGAFEKGRAIASQRVEHEFVHGHVDGQNVPLTDAHHGIVNPFAQPFFVGAAFFGDHYTTTPAFRRWWWRFRHLDDLLGVNPTFAFMQLTSPTEVIPVIAKIETGDVTVKFTQDAEAIAPWTKRGRTLVEITNSRPLPLSELGFAVVDAIQNFITFATFEISRIAEVKAENPRDGSEVIIIFAQRKSTSETRDLIPDNMLFSRHDLTNFEDSISKWVLLHGRIPYVMTLFFDLFRRRGDLTSGIVHIVETLEAFHCEMRMQPTERIPKADCEMLRREFDAVLRQRFGMKEPYVSWFNDSFRNDPPLASRLEALLTAENDVVAALFPDRADAVKAAKQYRNKFAHGLRKPSLSAAEMEKLFWLIERLVLLLCSSFLTTIGMPVDDRRAVFSRSSWFRRIVESAPTWMKSETV